MSATAASVAAPASAALSPRTRLLLEGPVARTLLRLAAPNVLGMVLQGGVGTPGGAERAGHGAAGGGEHARRGVRGLARVGRPRRGVAGLPARHADADHVRRRYGRR